MARRLVEATGSWADRVASTVVAGGAAERPVAVPRGQRHSPPRVRLRRRIVESLSVVHLVVDEPQEYGHTKGRVKHSFWRHGLSEWFFVRGPVGLYETVAEFTAIFHREGVQNACGAHSPCAPDTAVGRRARDAYELEGKAYIYAPYVLNI
jgi:hypothetical protein